jgi:hypothetical protein
VKGALEATATVSDTSLGSDLPAGYFLLIGLAYESRDAETPVGDWPGGSFLRLTSQRPNPGAWTMDHVSR